MPHEPLQPGEELEGKFITIWMDEAIYREHVMGWKGVMEKEQIVMIGGRVIRESGPGLWIEIELVLGEDDVDNPLQPDYFDKRPTHLVRWEIITSARIFKEKPERTEIGFRPRA